MSSRGWGPPADPTTLVLVRHGVTDHTVHKRFSGGLASSNPPLTEEGRAQARATGEWLQPLAGDLTRIVSSPVRRTRETAEELAALLSLEVSVEPGVAEMEFGSWDGLTYAEVHERFPDDLSSWLGDLDSAPHGGESLRAVQARVLEGRDRLLAAHASETLVVVSHVTPIKVLVADAVGATLDAAYRMELAPASVTVLSYFATPDGDVHPQMRLFNARPTGPV
ncbi:histidine phosphatase family protein [Nocardioides aequoreus]|uniref:histidine phosphatase family protein n=1 Tax=Nocardioides aequoreus TaxID=397278 RepID=UPI000691AD10|nr:histidine phosphatase family protein [Nocardioides aequoreus]